MSADSAHCAMLDTLGIVDPQISELSRLDCERSVQWAISVIKKAIDKSAMPESGQAGARSQRVDGPKKALITVATKLASDISDLESMSPEEPRATSAQTSVQTISEYISSFEKRFDASWPRLLFEALPVDDSNVFCKLKIRNKTGYSTQASAKDELVSLLDEMQSHIAQQQERYEDLRTTTQTPSGGRGSLCEDDAPIWWAERTTFPLISSALTNSATDSSMEPS